VEPGSFLDVSAVAMMVAIALPSFLSAPKRLSTAKRVHDDEVSLIAHIVQTLVPVFM
jgi:hypothetical protein